jgi:hypothetical protein
VVAQEDIPLEKVILNYMADKGLPYLLPKAAQAVMYRI